MNRTFLTLALVASLPGAALAQSSCATASEVTYGQYAVQQLGGAAANPVCSGNAAPAAFGAWYRFSSPLDTAIRVSSAIVGLPYVDTRMHVYTGTCDNLVCYSGDDDSGPGYSSIATFQVTAGVDYYIAWDSYWTASGFSFTIQGVPPVTSPQGTVSFVAMNLSGATGVQGVVDMNGDGLDDAVSPGSSSVTINYQLAGGGFSTSTIITPQADHTASWSFAAGDMDGNGFNDMMYGGGSGVTFMRANSAGTAYTELSFQQYIFSQRTNFVDVNNDGHLDAFVCHDVDANVHFINDGSNNFSFVQGGLGQTCGNYGSIWTDYDNDGDVDCFVAKCGCDPVDLLMRNNGDYTFTSMASSLGLADGHQSWSSAWGDFDNDGDMDMLIGSSSSNEHKLMANNGDGTFTNVTAGSGFDSFGGQSIEWTAHDFNNDGYVDIIGAGALHYNNGNMTFAPDPTAPGNGPIGDLNNDGFLDIAGGSQARMNQGNDNNWIKIIPIGVQSNRNGIGARIEVVSALGTQIRDVKSGDGFAYMSTMFAHFGIGDDTEIELVRIKWPSGIIDEIENPTINGTLTVTEGISTDVPALNDATLMAFPNPANELLTITGTSLNAPVVVTDVTGKVVLETRLATGVLPVSTLVPGLYHVSVVEGGEVRSLRFSKQ
jgi:hypothetical protein